MFGSIIGSVISAGSSFLNGRLNRDFNASEARAADSRSLDMWRYQQENGPSLYRQGLENAGYNPILAINGGLGSSHIPSTHAGSSSSSGVADIVGSAKQGSELVNNIKQAYKDKHEESVAHAESLRSDATSKAIHARNDTLKTLSEIEKNKTDIDLKKSQNTKTKVDTIRSPVSDAAKIGTGAATAIALDKLRKKVVEKVGVKVAPKVLPLLKGSPKTSFSGSVIPLFVGGALGVGKALDSAYEKSPNAKKVRDSKYFLHGNWSR